MHVEEVVMTPAARISWASVMLLLGVVRGGRAVVQMLNVDEVVMTPAARI